MTATKIKSIAGALDVMAQRTPLAVALQQGVMKKHDDTTPAGADSNNNNDNNKSFSYQELAQTSQALAGFLSAYGYERRDVLISDLPNTAEHVLVQLACNRLGVHFASAASLEDMAKFPRIRGAVTALGNNNTNTTATPGFLADINLPLPYLDDALLADLLYGSGNNHLGISLQADFGMESHNAGDVLDGVHAFYGSPDAGMTNQRALELGHQAAAAAVEAVKMTADDTVCIAAPLASAFGMGSDVTATFLTGATVVLPAVDNQQTTAEATFEAIQDCTLLFCDAATLQTLPAEPEKVQRLRGGLCKAGSGSTLLYETVGYGGVKLRTMGSFK